MSEVNIKFKKTRDNAVIPAYAHEGDAGLDMTAAHVEYDVENDCYKYYTGIAFESEKQVLMFAMPRSSNYKTECYLANGIGLIDTATYRGEVIFCYKPRVPIGYGMQMYAENAIISYLTKIVNNKDITSQEIISNILDIKSKAIHDYLEKTLNLDFAPFKVGERIGQMLVLEHPKVTLIEGELSKTERGEGGLGSTGK